MERSRIALLADFKRYKAKPAMHIIIKENAKLGWLAAKYLHTARVAIAFNSTIYLWNATREEFLSQTNWVCHEVAHILQFRKYGTWRFAWLYLVEWLKRGYKYNRFEIQARKMERSVNLLNEVEFL